MDKTLLLELIDRYKHDPFYLVAPDQREKEVMAQLARPAFRTDLAKLSLAFIPFTELCNHCDALCKFGEDATILRKIARVSRAALP